MFIVDRDYRRGHGDRFTVKAKESGFGSWKIDNLTLQQAMLAVEHYFGGHRNGTRGCAVCKDTKGGQS